METFFADVVLPVPMPRPYTYRVPRELEGLLEVGGRVVVQLGKKRVLTGICWGIHQAPPTEYEARPILDVLDAPGEPSLVPSQMRLFGWMAEYYMCSIGEVAFAALPSGLKLSSESRLQINPDQDAAKMELSDTERAVLAAITAADTTSFEELAAQPELAEHLTFTLKRLLAKRAILTYEQVRERYTPRRIRVLRLAQPYAANSVAMEGLLERLRRAPRQMEALARFIALVPLAQAGDTWLEKARLMEPGPGEDQGASTSAVRALIDLGVLEEREQTISRIAPSPELDEPAQNLSSNQARVVSEILAYFGGTAPALAKAATPDQIAGIESKEPVGLVAPGLIQRDIVLLHGVTGAGKTQVYMELIREALRGGGQVLYLLPEIALTTQIVLRLRQLFGDQMGVYHSRFSDNERVEVWRGLLEGRFRFIVGVRSAVLLPFSNLGLIVVDEEHEQTYKQAEPAPRYNGRDTALVLARQHGARVLLGSATPSLESYYQASTGVWGLVELLERFGKVELPRMELLDLRRARKQKAMQGSFSAELLLQMSRVLEDHEQIILFQNRRGYAPYLTCRECGWIPKCENCDVSLTYHQAARQLRCHYCGHTEPLPHTCRACGAADVRPIGSGTEKLEEETTLMLPGTRVLRMDQDTTRRKNALQDIISAFEQGDADVLVGTQMVTKGLDFDKVSLVGVFDTDRLMHFPDFRSHERTYQTITQVAGRAGRRKKQGRVLIQTANPEAPLLRYICEQDYLAFYNAELAERERYHYPPFTRLIRLTLKHEDKAALEEPAAWLAGRLRQSLSGPAVLGPEPPLVERIRNLYLLELHLKLPREGTNFAYVKQILRDALAQMPKFKGVRDVRIVVDVDPY